MRFQPPACGGSFLPRRAMMLAPLGERTARHDVAFKFRHLDPRSVCLGGFDLELSTDALAPGEYKLGVVHAGVEALVAGFSEQRIVVG